VASLRTNPSEAVGKRIVHVIGSLGAGGSEQQAIHVLLGLVSRGNSDITLLHEQPMQPPHDFFLGRLHGTPVVTKELTPLFLRPPQQWAIDSDVTRIINAVDAGDVGARLVSYYLEFRARRPAVVHTWLDGVNVTAGIAAVLAGVPKVVVSCRSVAPIHFNLFAPYMRPLYRFLATCPNVTLLNNSRAGATDYCRWLGLESNVIRVIYNAFDFSRVPPGDILDARIAGMRQQWRVSPAERIVGTVMRLSEEKRPLLWVEVAAEIAACDDAVKFVILGDGPHREKVAELVRDRGLEDKVVLTGYEADTVSSIAAMDVFLLTSRMEGLPNVLIEAQAVGVPVVSASVGGAPETFENGVTGLAVADANARTLAASVLRILRDPDFGARTRARAPALVRERFEPNGILSDLLAIYDLEGATQPETAVLYAG
jgi:glycosyltransferase involved in cell wall biosynthesis